MEARYLKRMMQLLFSISVVSFLVFISSWLSYGFHTVRFCVATLPVQLITHSINRNCIFLICNGLLVFIAKSSGLTCSNNTSASSISQPSSSSTSSHVKDKETVAMDAKPEEEEESLVETAESEAILLRPVDKEIVMVHNDDSSFKRWFFDQVNMEKTGIREDDGARNEDIKELSMDEVNKRFNDFIWKIKEEIRQEASEQQIAGYMS